MKRLLPVLLAAALVMTSCTAESREEVKAPTEISYSWWGKDIRHAYTIDALSDFEKMEPDINVKKRFGEFDGYRRRIGVDIAANNECDVMLINYDWLSRFSPDGTGFYDMYELSNYIELSNFSQADLSYGEINGRLNGISTALNTQIFFYNKDMYDSYGLELPKTWDDLFEAAKVMNKDGVYPLSISRKAAWLMAVAYAEQKTGVRCLDDKNDPGFTKEQTTDMLDFYCSMIRAGVARPIAENDKNDFEDKTAAGRVMWISDAAYYCAGLIGEGVNVAIGEDLVSPEAKIFGWYAKPTSLYCIKRNTASPEEAAKLVNFLLNSEEMSKKQGIEKGIPLSRSAQEVLEANEMLKGIQYDAYCKLKEMEEIRSIAPRLENDEIVTAFETLSENVIYNGADVNEAGAELYNIISETAKQ